MTRNYFFLLAFSLITFSSLLAVPAVPWAVEKIQPDGTKISVFLKGDEYVSWMESVDGYILMYDAQKYVVYAQKDGQGNLTPSTIKFGSVTKPDVNIIKGLRYSKAQINTFMQIRGITQDATVQRAPTGTIKALCVLAAFSGSGGAFVKTNAEFDALMNQVGYNVGGAQGSVRDYYYESSYGLVTLQVTVVGSVTLSNTSSYYADHLDDFAKDVINLADPIVDFSQFASGGEVNTFHIIFAGYGDEAIDDGQQIWSHAGTPNVSKDGVKIIRYFMFT